MAAIAGAVMAGLAVFEIALAAGLPWGAAAWGGGQSVLSPGMRIASVGAAAIWIVGLLAVLRRGEHRVWSLLPDRWLGATVWIIAAYSTLMILANGASSSGAERALMTPASVILTVTCVFVARVGRGGRP
jgi:hypothetical protein